MPPNSECHGAASDAAVVGAVVGAVVASLPRRGESSPEAMLTVFAVLAVLDVLAAPGSAVGAGGLVVRIS